jgi:hypothetical protein
MCSFVLLAVNTFAQEIKDPNPPTGVTGGVTPRGTGSDTFGHTFDNTVPFQAVDITTTGTMVASGDDVSGVVTLQGSGQFNVYGTLFTQLTAASNGYISTDPTDTGPDLSNDCPLPSGPSTGGGNRMYPLHDDLIADIYYEYFSNCPRPSDLGGNLGCHVFQWANTNHFGGSDSWDQWAILYESTWEMVFQVGPGNSELGSGSTTGIQNEAATDGLTYVCNSPNSLPDNSAVAFFNPQGQLPPCTIDGIALVNDGTGVQVQGDCDAFDLFRVTNGVSTLVGTFSVSGSTIITVGFVPDSFYQVTISGDTVVLATTNATVPTLGEWGMIAFLSLLAIAGLFFVRKRRFA